MRDDERSGGLDSLTELYSATLGMRTPVEELVRDLEQDAGASQFDPPELWELTLFAQRLAGLADTTAADARTIRSATFQLHAANEG